MSDKDTKDYGLSAKTDPITERFNLENELAERVTSASPEAQSRIKDRLELRNDRMDKEKQNQKRSHQFRLNREKVQLMEKFILENAPRPDHPEVRVQDLQIINEDAAHRLSSKEEYYLKTIEKEAQADVRQILSNDRQQDRSTERNQQDHEQEH